MERDPQGRGGLPADFRHGVRIGDNHPEEGQAMDRSDLLHLLYLLLVLAVILARWWWPGLRLRKYDWRWFTGKKKP